MDDQDAGTERPAENLISRPPTEADLAALCRELNQRQAKYVVIGGLAIIAAGLPRMTTDVDLMVAADAENKRKFSPHWPPCQTMPRSNSSPANSSNTTSSGSATKSWWTCFARRGN